MVDWKNPTVVFVLVTLFFLFFLRENNQNVVFQIDQGKLKYHSNWTSKYQRLPHQKEFKDALSLNKLKELDISFAHSQFQANFVKKLFQDPFSSSFQKAKINMGSIPLRTPEIQYLLSLLPNNLKSLQLYLDSVEIDSQFGVSFAYQLNRFTLLESLTVSLVLSATQNPEQIGIFFKLHKPREQLKSLNLILIGNQFKPEHVKRLPEYLNKFNLENLDLNLYANKIGAAGANFLAQSLKSQSNLKRLNIDLYFNNVTQVGTKSICQQVKKIQKLTSLGLNFDFNFIKNEGGKQIGNLLKQMNNLSELQIGVASKNFGYLGFKSVIDGMKNLKDLTKLTLRCGVNRVGINGAQIVKQMLQKMTKLTYLNIGFIQNYIGDQGLKLFSSTVSKMSSLKQVLLNLGFNDAKSYGLIESLKNLADKNYEYLYLGFSHNEFRDQDIQLIKKYLPQLIKNNQIFDFDFVDTAISKKMVKQIQDIFQKNNKNYRKNSKLSINSIIQEELNVKELDLQTKKQQQRIKSKLDLSASEKLIKQQKQKTKNQKKQKQEQEQEQKSKAQKEAKQKAQKIQKQTKERKLKEKADKQEKQVKERQIQKQALKLENQKKQKILKQEKEKQQKAKKEQSQRLKKQAIQKAQQKDKQRKQKVEEQKKQKQQRQQKQKVGKQEAKQTQKQAQQQTKKTEAAQNNDNKKLENQNDQKIIQTKTSEQDQTAKKIQLVSQQNLIEPEPILQLISPQVVDPKLISLGEQQKQL